MLQGLGLKLLLGGLGLALLMGAFFTIKDAFDDRRELREHVALILETTKVASDNPDLKTDGIVAQIKTLGEAYDLLRGELTKQNEAVDQLGEERKTALAEADRQASLRKEVIRESQELARELRTGAFSPVEKENLEAELRRVQDMAWELGL